MTCAAAPYFGLARHYHSFSTLCHNPASSWHFGELLPVSNGYNSVTHVAVLMLPFGDKVYMQQSSAHMGVT
ncbi:hypothetical protein CY34DRAFT_805283 [Suillus luteus UH-Slu-Lm8-n1]|uniref:Uncharacterized protein n=1 Tax=Suillus luteus UH-Slu-Lm8-n1 TaxID=930992 RepID=A0A0D0AWA9_9AGAM|nr:hypothetical protein CY34DRAFT_805283 [Suillus luteus UH-Slu-Lm8-n1]